MGYVYLAIAIISEVIGTNALKASDGFSRLVPASIVVTGYAASFYLLSLALKSIPIGMAYAIWAGLGIVLIAISGVFFFNEKLDMAALIGMALIVSGVVVMRVFSKAAI